MPAVAASGQQGGGDELGPGDEIKVFKDEGEDEREQGGSETLQAELLEEKSSLITDTESEHQVSKIKKMELCRKRLFRLNHSVCSASTTVSCPLIACSFDRDPSFFDMSSRVLWELFWVLSWEEEVQISSNSRLGFLSVWGFRFAWKKEAVTWQKVQCRRSRDSSTATAARWKEFRGVFAACGRGGKITFSFQLTASRRHHSAGI